jgi:hypothetical protein
MYLKLRYYFCIKNTNLKLIYRIPLVEYKFVNILFPKVALQFFKPVYSIQDKNTFFMQISLWDDFTSIVYFRRPNIKCFGNCVGTNCENGQRDVSQSCQVLDDQWPVFLARVFCYQQQ